MVDFICVNQNFKHHMFFFVITRREMELYKPDLPIQPMKKLFHPTAELPAQIYSPKNYLFS